MTSTHRVRRPQWLRYDPGFNPRQERRYGRESWSYHPVLDFLARLFPRTFSDGTPTLIAIVVLISTGIVGIAYLGLVEAGKLPPLPLFV